MIGQILIILSCDWSDLAILCYEWSDIDLHILWLNFELWLVSWCYLVSVVDHPGAGEMWGEMLMWEQWWDHSDRTLLPATSTSWRSLTPEYWLETTNQMWVFQCINQSESSITWQHRDHLQQSQSHHGRGSLQLTRVGLDRTVARAEDSQEGERSLQWYRQSPADVLSHQVWTRTHETVDWSQSSWNMIGLVWEILISYWLKWKNADLWLVDW